MANYNSSYTGAQIDSAVGRANSTDVTAGTVAASKAVVVDSNKDVTGFRNITGTGTATFANFVGTGDIDIGDASGDTVTITASVDSNIVPSADDTYDLGGSSAQWKDLYVDGTAYIDAIDFNGTAITASATEINLLNGITTLSGSNTGDQTLPTDFVSAASGGTFSGNVSFGDNNITNVGDISLDSISSDAGTSINVVLGSDAGDDFTVDTSKLVVEGDTGNVGIGTAAPDELLHLLSSEVRKPVLKIENTNADDNGAKINFYKTSASAADNDQLGNIRFYGLNDAGSPETIIFAQIWASSTDVSDGSEDAAIHFGTMAAGSESNNNLVLSSGNVGIGTASPSSLLHLDASDGTVQITVDSGGSDATQIMFQRDAVDEFLIGQDGGGNNILKSSANWPIQFLDSSDNVVMEVETSSGNVGIGTAAPEGSLEIKNTNATEADPHIALEGSGGSDDDWAIWAPAGTNKLYFGYTGQATNMVLASGGNVGIGTDSPDSLLSVYSTTTPELGIYYDSSGHANARNWMFRTNHNAYGNFKISYSDDVGGDPTDNDALTIDSSGNVGIGTTGPAEALHVVGNIIGGNNATNATRKYARYGAYHYTNAEEPFYALFVDANETQNYLRIGGGTGAGNASTSIFFYTAANTTTTDGTLALTIDGSQNATFAGTIGSGAITSTSSVKAEYHTLMDDSTVCGHLVREETITGAGSSRDVCLFAEGATDGGAIHFMTGGSVSKVLTLDASNNATFTGNVTADYITVGNNQTTTRLSVDAAGYAAFQFGGDTNGSFCYNNTTSRNMAFGVNQQDDLVISNGGHIAIRGNATVAGTLAVDGTEAYIGQNSTGTSHLQIRGSVWSEPHIHFYSYSNFNYKIGNYGTSAPKQFMLKTNDGSVVFETGGSNSADVWFGGNVSAASVTDRTPYPETLQIAYDVLSSHKKLSDYDVDDKEHQLDHTKLHDFAKPQITVSSGTPDNEVLTKELGQDGRDASAVISCLVEVVNDLISKVTALENA